jgi:hypothetical protein
MTFPCKLAAAGTLGLLLFPLTFLPSATSAAAADDLAFPPITAQARPWAWWWWHGSAVDETNLQHELERFHDAGLGGVQITSIYGTKGAESREIPYLTPHWLAMMGFTVDHARTFGMGVDMSLGSGWCFGGPTVNDQDANASVVVKKVEVAAGQKITAKFPPASTQALVAYPATGDPLEITGNISATGDVDWIAPGNAGSWTVYAISQKPSGQKVKRPAVGGEGWMLNPAYPQAVRDWLTWFDQALAPYHGSKPEAVFQDSYEYRTDWAPDFFAQFEKRRGYRLQTELPALFADPSRSADRTTPNSDHIARVKYDYRRTISEIIAQESEPAWIDWAHRNGFRTIYQAHGTPANWLDLYGDADLPETEMFHDDRSIFISKFASSAAHTQGRPLIGAETGTWLKEHFTETLADVKYLADDMFLAGINHLYYHGACYSPDDAPWPGWLFYASTEMNPRNSIWHDVSALNEYIARCQSVLQSGVPDNDVLLYWPVADFWTNPSGRLQPMAVGKTEWFEGQPIGKTAHQLWNLGYAFDYVSDAQLLKATVADGKIQLPGGKYQVIVVPPCQYIPLETFRQLIALAKAGAKIIFQDQLPAAVSGAANLKPQTAEFQTLLRSLPSDPAGDGKLGQGTVWVGEAPPALVAAGVSSESMGTLGLSFVRRSFDGGWNYFIANRAATNFDRWITLARPAQSAEMLDPMTGISLMAVSRPGAPNYLELYLQLAPGGSVIVRAFADKKVAGQPWTFWHTNGQSLPILGPWNVKFISGGPTIPADFQTSKLTSWTTFPDPAAQAFAGTARYETTFAAPDSTGKVFELSLGDVRQSARIKLNGQFYGTLIAPPFRVMVGNLKPSGNLLEVEVTSVAANRIRDLDRRGVNWKIFKDINLVDVSYHPFDASNWPLTDCGLLGPVTLTHVNGN